MVTSDIMKLGPYFVTCTPLTRFDNWKGLLGLGCNSKDGFAGLGKLLQDYAVWYEFALDRGKVSFFINIDCKISCFICSYIFVIMSN